MIKIIKYLVLIRFRKILPKDDYLAIFLFLLFYAVVIYFLNQLFPKYSYYFLLSVLELVFYHQNRKDIEMLKVNKKYLSIIFTEYLIYSFPFLFVYIFNKRWDFVIIHFLLLTFLTAINKKEIRSIKFPFKLFDPYWHICFRKYKLIVLIPLIIFLNLIAFQYHNENLSIASLFVVSFIGCLPSFNREQVIHLKVSVFNSRQYLLEQIKATFYNILLLTIILLFCLLFFQKWELLWFVPLVFLFPMISVLFKYSFFNNILLQQLFFALFVGNIQTGLPLLILPYLYYLSIKKITHLQYVTD